MTKQEVLESLSDVGFFRHWISRQQRKVLILLVHGDEGAEFIRILTELKATIEAMPKTYSTDSRGLDAVVHLHYFLGGIEAWITEKDMGDPADEDPGAQLQAFGKITLSGDKSDAEFGYIGIDELIANGVEIDLHWKPVTLKEI